MAARLPVARSDPDLLSSGAAAAQAWRDPQGRQTELVRLFKAVEVRPVDRPLGQDAGALSGTRRRGGRGSRRAGTGDAVDATVVAVADTGDRILAGGAVDAQALAAASGRPILVAGV